MQGRGIVFWIRVRDSTPWEGLAAIPTLIALHCMAGRARSDAAEFHQFGGLGEAPTVPLVTNASVGLAIFILIACCAHDVGESLRAPGSTQAVAALGCKFL